MNKESFKDRLIEIEVFNDEKFKITHENFKGELEFKGYDIKISEETAKSLNLDIIKHLASLASELSWYKNDILDNYRDEEEE